MGVKLGLALALVVACGPIYPATEPAPAASSPHAGGPLPPPQSHPTSDPAPQQLDSSQQQFLDAHNRVREAHCAPPLRWSKPLTARAKQWADHLAHAGCIFQHSNGGTGENLAAGTFGALDEASSVAMWADEEKLYRFPNGGFSMKTGHFTQLVWRATTHVGCGHSQCNGNEIYVCEYDPAGNVDGEYAENVKPPGPCHAAK